MDNPLTQTRSQMAARLPEYRPFSIQTMLQSIQGGAKKKAVHATASKPQQRSLSSSSGLLPPWLDLCLYFTLAIVLGAAIFMALFSRWVAPHKAITPVGSEMVFFSNHEKNVDTTVSNRNVLSSQPNNSLPNSSSKSLMPPPPQELRLPQSPFK